MRKNPTDNYARQKSQSLYNLSFGLGTKGVFLKISFCGGACMVVDAEEETYLQNPEQRCGWMVDNKVIGWIQLS